MSLNIPTQQLLSDGKKWFAYSGIKQGDVSVPATITLIDIPNTGLRDSYVCIQFSFGQAISSSGTQTIGGIITIDDIEVVRQQGREYPRHDNDTFKLFVPRQSKLSVISLNSTSNNTQDRGATITGYYL